MSRRSSESRVYGVNACRALFVRRVGDIIRVYLTEEQLPAFGDLLSTCARLRRPYRIVSTSELEAVTESRHHEGICIVARPRAAVALEDLLRAPGPACVVGLVDVGNPHNIGAILRTAAHFGVRGAVFLGAGGDAPEPIAASDADIEAGADADDEALGDDDMAALAAPPGAAPATPVRLSAAAARTSQGGAEWLDFVHERDQARALRAARAAGFTIAATSSHGGLALYAGPLPPRLLLLVGAEDEGLTPATLAAADVIVSVPGTGQVESLNVAAATALVLGEHWRGRAAPATRPKSAAAPQAARPAAPTSAAETARGGRAFDDRTSRFPGEGPPRAAADTRPGPTGGLGANRDPLRGRPSGPGRSGVGAPPSPTGRPGGRPAVGPRESTSPGKPAWAGRSAARTGSARDEAPRGAQPWRESQPGDDRAPRGRADRREPAGGDDGGLARGRGFGPSGGARGRGPVDSGSGGYRGPSDRGPSDRGPSGRDSARGPREGGFRGGPSRGGPAGPGSSDRGGAPSRGGPPWRTAAPPARGGGPPTRGGGPGSRGQSGRRGPPRG
jgi:TrmH RNA methyltransferase